ncbi:MAG: DUF4249 domain-containing protein [Bacteroidales bacterium]
MKEKQLHSISLKFLSVIFLTALFLIVSCEDLVTNIDFPDSEPKIVVHSFISPADTAVMVLLTWSNPISSNESYWMPEIIEDAEVQITETGGATASLDYIADRSFYSVSTEEFPIRAGEKYALSVKLPDGRSVDAECFVPYKNESLELIDTNTVYLNEWETNFRVEYTFVDPGINRNYYYSGVYKDTKYFDYENYEWRSTVEKFWIIYGESYIYADGEEEKEYLIKAETYLYEDEYPENPPDDMPEDEEFITIMLLTTDEHYYQYHKDLEYYYPDDMFSESTHIYSNINGGLGIFAGYNKYEIKFLMEQN